MRPVLALAPLLLAGLAVLPALALAGHACDPYPIGRCGDYQRESLVFCYASGKPLGVYLDATERSNIVSVGSGGFDASVQGLGSVSSAALLAPVLALLPVAPGGSDAQVPAAVEGPFGLGAQVPAPAGGAFARAYVNVTPLLKFAADPFNAPLPNKAVYRETNGSPGLQLVNHRCAAFVWFAECEPAQWMVFNPSGIRAPDARVA